MANESKALDFILQYQHDVVRFAFFLCRNEAVAHDLAQETFLKVLDRELTGIENPKAYLFQIAKNLHIDMARRRKTEQNYEKAQFETSTIEQPDLEVWETLFSMEADDCQLILLIDREGLSLNEASEIMRLPETTLKTRLFRAREEFKKKWNR